VSGESPPERTTVYRHAVRYLEADQQGVVFNMWYLGYFDEAMACFLAEGGLAYPQLLESGYDVQLVHSDIDWSAPLRWPGEAVVEVSLDSIGTTSFALRFDVSSPDGRVASGRTVYVVVGTDGSGKRPIPAALGAALAGAAPEGA
jgi:acyl-CoA thioester hydrolase